MFAALLGKTAELIYKHQTRYWGRKRIGVSSAYKLRRFLINRWDPVIEMPYGSFNLKMKLSHNLPLYQAVEPLYDTALPRIARQLCQIDGHVKFIDVGANIGDTVAAVYPMITNGAVLAIEGDSQYLPILNENIQRIRATGTADIFIEPVFLGSKNAEIVGVVESRGTGTTRISTRKDENSHTSIFVTPLDEVYSKYKTTFLETNLLKVDVDGFECEVFKGARKLMSEVRPLVHFEFIPGLLADNDTTAWELLELVTSAGYRTGLIYNIAGEPLSLVDLTNRDQMEKFVNSRYGLYANNDPREGMFDILTYHKDSVRYHHILESELNLKVENARVNLI